MANALEVDDLKSFLDFKTQQYNSLKFIDEDPIKIAKKYTRKEDIEIMSFIISTISWGNRTSIINSGKKLSCVPIRVSKGVFPLALVTF